MRPAFLIGEGMKKALLYIGSFLGISATILMVWFFLFINPRHYEADDFGPLAEAISAAEELRLSGTRGALAEEAWPDALVDLGAKSVHVYPTGVLVKLHGFFTFESGLYFPSGKVMNSLDALDQSVVEIPIYIPLKEGVYSYRVTE